MIKKIIGIFSAVLCVSTCLVFPDIARADEDQENEPAVYSEFEIGEDGINTENIDETTGAEDTSAPESDVNTEIGEGQESGEDQGFAEGQEPGTGEGLGAGEDIGAEEGLGAGEGLGAPEAGATAAPSAQSVTMAMNGADDPGFTVTVSGLSAPGGMKVLQAAVWSRDDQKNLVWYKDPVVNEAGAYVFSSTLASHGNQEGTYYAHVYLTDNEGASYFIGGDSSSAKVSWSGITASYDSASKTAAFAVNDLAACGLADRFIYYVWSDNNGQDDMKAFTATSANAYNQTVDMTQFKDKGTFYVHCYAVLKNGTNRFVDGKAFEVTGGGSSSAEPSAGSVSMEFAGQTSPKFTVTVSNLSAPSGIKELKAAVWSEADQSNLVWYTDYTAGSGGTYTFDNCTLASHKSMQGRYNAHVYLVDNNGKAYFIGGVAKDIAVSYSGISASYDQGSRQSAFAVNGLSDYGLTDTVIYYVWSDAGGQDDIKEYTVSASPYSKTINMSDFKKTGTYIVHCYAKLKNGESKFIDGKTFDVSASSSGSDTGSSEASSDGVSVIFGGTDSSEFTVSIGGLTAPNGIKELKAAVWSEADQNNLVWYTDYVKNSDGTYSFNNCSLSKHKNLEGKYNVHVYLKDNSGKESFVGGVSKEIAVSYSKMTVSYDNGTQKAEFSPSGISDYGLTNSLVYYVWSNAGGQDDLKAFTATRNAGFKYTVDMNTFRRNGTYHVHCYALLKNGESKFVDGKSFTVAGLDVTAECVVDNISDSQVRITVYGATVNGKEPAKVLLPTWSTAIPSGASTEQDDIKWYEAEKNEDGSFTAVIDRHNHKSSGTFVTHVYAYPAEEGAEGKFLWGTSYNLYKVEEFGGENAEVTKNILYAVETGGQVYGNCRYNDFTPAYAVTSSETGITIGAGSWFGRKAVQLLLDIRAADPALFAANDTAGISVDLDNLLNMDVSTWDYYGGSETIGGVFTRGSAKAVAIQNIISTDVGIAVQDRNFIIYTANYINSAASLGVRDIDAQIFAANINHLGGPSALRRIINNVNSAGLDLIMENIWAVMTNDVNDASSNHQVGDSMYHRRHNLIMRWIYDYLN